MRFKITPIIQWAGGKRQLIPTIKEMLPLKYNNYFEPFFGGGALFCELTYDSATINDFNPCLMNLYVQTKENPNELCNAIDNLCNQYNSVYTQEEKEKLYYSVREEFNREMAENELTVQNAANLMFLNRTGFNALYRINSSGKYNVPFGNKEELKIYSKRNLLLFSDRLNSENITILCGDFEDACKNAKAGDFVFFDSPYYETFDTYQQGGFTEQDHLRLYRLFVSLSEKGVYCMATNNDCEYIKNLYKDYNVTELDVKRMINRDGDNRVGKEVIITNYSDFVRVPRQIKLF